MKKLITYIALATSLFAFNLSDIKLVDKLELKGSYCHQTHSQSGASVNYDTPKNNGYSIAIANYSDFGSTYKPFVEIEYIKMPKRNLKNILLGIDKKVYKDISLAGGIGYSMMKWDYQLIASATKKDYTSNKPLIFVQAKYTKEIDKTKDISIGIREYRYNHETKLTRTSNTMTRKDDYATSIFVSLGYKF
jgi:hypothetical protein